MKKSGCRRMVAGALAFGAAMVMAGSTAYGKGWSKNMSEHIEIRAEQRAQGRAFEGWGTSLCWWANRLGYSDVLAQKSADLFYGEDGLRLNIMRYNRLAGVG